MSLGSIDQIRADRNISESKKDDSEQGNMFNGNVGPSKQLVIPRHQSPMKLEPFPVRKKRFDLKKGPEKVLEDAPGGIR